MSYSLKLYDSDGASQAQHREAEQRFRQALDQTLGDETMVGPVYAAYLRIVGTDKCQHWDSRRHFFAGAASTASPIRTLPSGSGFVTSASSISVA